MAGPSMIDSSRIEAMVAKLQAMAATAQGAGRVDALQPVAKAADGEQAAPRVDFADVLKGAMDQVNDSQQSAAKMSQAFALGDNNINLSDVMIASQKAGISFQTSIQVRNKLVSAYRDIMTMQV